MKDLIVKKQSIAMSFSLFIILLFINASSMALVFGSFYLMLIDSMEEEKSKGTELLLTTYYNRKNIIISKYIFYIIIVLLEALVFSVLYFLTLGLKTYYSFSLPMGIFNLDLLDFCYVINTLVLSLLIIAVLTPLSVIFKYKTFLLLSSLIGSIALAMTFFIQKFLHLWFLALILLIFMYIISFSISIRVYSKKDL